MDRQKQFILCDGCNFEGKVKYLSYNAYDCSYCPYCGTPFISTNVKKEQKKVVFYGVKEEDGFCVQVTEITLSLTHAVKLCIDKDIDVISMYHNTGAGLTWLADFTRDGSMVLDVAL